MKRDEAETYSVLAVVDGRAVLFRISARNFTDAQRKVEKLANDFDARMAASRAGMLAR